jgi:arylsulfatase A-like enzyme
MRYLPFAPTALSQAEQHRQRPAQQLASLKAVARAVGAILDKLAAVSQDQNTLVLYTGDNGDSWGSHCHRPKRPQHPDHRLHVSWRRGCLRIL